MTVFAGLFAVGFWAAVAVCLGLVAGRVGARLLPSLIGDRAVPRGWCEAGCALGFLPLPVLGCPTALVAAVVVWWLVCLSVADLTARLLPNVLTLTGTLVFLGAAAVIGRGTPALLGALAFAGAYLVVHLVSPRAMGAGDVKLALGLGALCGAQSAMAVLATALGASLISGLAGVFLLVVRRNSGAALAHGASMCLAAYTALAFVLV